MILHSACVLPESKVIAQLHKSPLKFYLTGSRFMGCATPESDWDFVVEDSMDSMYALIFMGFEPSSAFKLAQKLDDYDIWAGELKTNDGHTNDVWQLWEDGVKYQVQLTNHLDAKLFARDTIRAYYYDYHLNASTSKRIELWHMLCTAYLSSPAKGTVAPKNIVDIICMAQ